MPKKPVIPMEVQEEVLKIVDEFNRKTFPGEPHPLVSALLGETKRGFVGRFKDNFLYLDRAGRRRASKICRLTWNGKMDNWDFAIHRQSRGYDPSERMFTGVGHVDGTVEGAMKAGMEAYPM